MTAVLVIDDEPDVRLLTRILLEMEGHDVSEVPDGESAIEFLRGEHAIEVVLLDLRMPGISGWDVLEQLQHEDLLPDFRVIIFSAHMEPQELQRAIEQGAEAYLTKPFTAQQLYAALAG